ncbi:4-trimethylaminobutyraldehyde dehydrogenase-like [Octopus vulgaris]|uniref:4-trimethylaminobutyraldehyde dehydrogenase-like n=1 Tax=Octopus vulgaris TaxID=6645 RepID=A0AA36BX97_OCTVU|nr:4-trimethylaminobutyraldehyde dehydrogenase-like [Octopus vulgaris]
MEFWLRVISHTIDIIPTAFAARTLFKEVRLLYPEMRRSVVQLVAKKWHQTFSTYAQEQCAAVQQSLNFVNGARVEPKGQDKETLPLVIPSTGEVLRTFHSSGAKDVDDAVNSARSAAQHWSQLSGFERGKILRKAAQLLKERREEFSQIEVLDSGKPIWEARADVDGCIDCLEYFGGLAANLAGEHLILPGGSFNYTRREPLGVVGAIGAWNYPIQMASWKSAPALACGNAMVFKPSPLTPISAVMLGEVYAEAGLPAGCYNVVQGAAATGQLLSNHSNIDKMTFTGSVPTGTKIMEACAKGIKHVTLELGGKSPLIVFANSDLESAVNGAVLANFLNAGQVCSNGTRVFVEKRIAEKFLEELIAKTSKMKAGDPMREDTTIGASISKEQAEKTLHFIEIAKKEGATVAYGGGRITLEDPKFQKGNFIKPCILTNLRDDMTVVKEEVFGAVLSLLVFDSEEEVVRRANDSCFGLAGGIFTKDLQQAHRVAGNLQTGSIYVNNYNVVTIGIPFGGFKMSGIGHENAAVTMNYYTHLKSVYIEMAEQLESPV